MLSGCYPTAFSVCLVSGHPDGRLMGATVDRLASMSQLARNEIGNGGLSGAMAEDILALVAVVIETIDYLNDLYDNDVASTEALEAALDALLEGSVAANRRTT